MTTEFPKDTLYTFKIFVFISLDTNDQKCIFEEVMPM